MPNAETWLDFTDLVFIDPVDTGYSRAAGSAEDIRNRYFNIEGDVGTLSAVITRWLRQNNRLTSPKFLIGESYGGFRAPRIAHELQKDVGVGLNGIVMLSPVLDFGWFSQPRHAPWVHAVRLPSYVAAATEGKAPAHPRHASGGRELCGRRLSRRPHPRAAGQARGRAHRRKGPDAHRARRR